MRDDELLFWKYDWFNIIEHQKAKLLKHIDGLQIDFFDTRTLDELADELAEKFSVRPPIITQEDIEVSQREIDIDVSRYRDRHFSTPGAHHVKGTEIEVRLPFSGDKDMFFVKPSTYNLNPPRGRVCKGYISFAISGTGLTPENVKSEIDKVVQSIDQFLGYQAQSVGNFPQEIRQIARQALEHRHEKLEADKDLVSSLGYKVR